MGALSVRGCAQRRPGAVSRLIARTRAGAPECHSGVSATTGRATPRVARTLGTFPPTHPPHLPTCVSSLALRACSRTACPSARAQLAARRRCLHVCSCCCGCQLADPGAVCPAEPRRAGAAGTTLDHSSIALRNRTPHTGGFSVKKEMLQKRPLLKEMLQRGR